MKRRTLVRSLVKAGLLASVAAFAAVFVYGLFSPGMLSDNTIELGGMPEGSARLEAWNGKPVWIVRRSPRQLEAIAELSAHVATPAAADAATVDDPHRSLQDEYGIYLAATERQGILVQYVSDRPASLESSIPWHGGFVDPAGDALFDAAGRRYRTTRGAPLAVPPHRYVGPGVVRLGEW